MDLWIGGVHVHVMSQIPMDPFWCGGFVKLLVLADKPQAMDNFEVNIHCVILLFIAHMNPQLLKNVVENCLYNTSQPGTHMSKISDKQYYCSKRSISLLQV